MKLERDPLPQVFTWVRSANPTQPLTSGLWQDGDWSVEEQLTPIERIQLAQSDVLSFHNYAWPEDFEQHAVWLQLYHRPIICTEFMARPLGSTFDTLLPLARKYHVGMNAAALVYGKIQSYLPWESWDHPYILQQPPVWCPWRIPQEGISECDNTLHNILTWQDDLTHPGRQPLDFNRAELAQGGIENGEVITGVFLVQEQPKPTTPASISL